MSFENPHKNQSSSEISEKPPTTSRRDFIRKAFGFGASIALTKGIVEILPDFEKVEETNSAPVFVRKPMLQEEDFDISKEEELQTLEEDIEGQNQSNDNREVVDWKKFKHLKPNVQYYERSPEPYIENLNLPQDLSKYGATTFEGKIIRTFRFKNITDAVEEKYNLPSGILLAMIMEESTGVDLLPNGRGDGGFGLCHMQGLTAVEYGLRTFKRCDALVCDGKDNRSCKGSHQELRDHAGELAKHMKTHAHDRAKLIELDERLNILLNIDAAGRMLATGIAGPKLSGKLSELGPLRRSIARYAGAYNYEQYWKDICQNMRDLNSSFVLEKVEDFFNQRNKDLRINGEKADFKKYLMTYWGQNKNYGLEEYKKLPKYIASNSQQVMKTYKDHVYS